MIYEVKRPKDMPLREGLSVVFMWKGNLLVGRLVGWGERTILIEKSFGATDGVSK